jgi:hypothetical protein
MRKWMSGMRFLTSGRVLDEETAKITFRSTVAITFKATNKELRASKKGRKGEG